MADKSGAREKPAEARAHRLHEEAKSRTLALRDAVHDFYERGPLYLLIAYGIASVSIVAVLPDAYAHPPLFQILARALHYLSLAFPLLPFSMTLGWYAARSREANYVEGLLESTAEALDEAEGGSLVGSDGAELRHAISRAPKATRKDPFGAILAAWILQAVALAVLIGVFANGASDLAALNPTEP